MKFVTLAASAVLFAISVSATAQNAPAAAPATPAPAPAAAPAPAVAPAAAPAAPKAAAAAAPASADALEGKIAHYGRKFNGRKTACGVVFNANKMTMAHKSLPCGTVVRVTNVKNKKSVIVTVTDRGPSTPDRIGDLTTAAARKIGMTKAGVVDAKITVRKAAKKAKK
jgi:rare lipoprotein A